MPTNIKLVYLRLKFCHSSSSRNSNSKLVEWATEIKVRAERRAGELIKEGDFKSGHPKANAATLSALGIHHHQSSRWQKLASITEEII